MNFQAMTVRKLQIFLKKNKIPFTNKTRKPELISLCASFSSKNITPSEQTLIRSPLTNKKAAMDQELDPLENLESLFGSASTTTFLEDFGEPDLRVLFKGLETSKPNAPQHTIRIRDPSCVISPTTFATLATQNVRLILVPEGCVSDLSL